LSHCKKTAKEKRKLPGETPLGEKIKKQNVLGIFLGRFRIIFPSGYFSWDLTNPGGNF